MDEALARALKRQAALKAELAKVERFIAAHRDLFGKEQEASAAGGSARAHTLADMAERILAEVGRPLSRAEMVVELEKRAFPVRSQDKARYVASVLRRSSDRFEYVGQGYWLRSRPLPEGSDLEGVLREDDEGPDPGEPPVLGGRRR